VPLSEVVAQLGGADQRGGDGLVRAAFSMHQQPEERVLLGSEPARLELGVFNGAAKFPVNVIALASGTGSATRVQLLLEGAAGAVTSDDLWALWTLTIHWLREWVGQPIGPPGPPCQLTQRVREHAAGTGGDTPALDDGQEQLSYRALVALGEAARDRLRWAGCRVGILGAASTRFFGCAYAAVHAGATYVPLPVEKPAATLLELARRAGCEVVVDVTGGEGGPVLAELGRTAPQVTCLPWAAMAAAVRPAPPDGQPAGSPGGQPSGSPGGQPAEPPAVAAAYVIFTSGSTGAPKGVVISRPALHRLAAWASSELELGPGTVVGQTASVSFDASVFELWSALYAGASLRIAPAPARPDPYELARWLDGAQVERAFVGTPIAELIFLLGQQPGCLRAMATGGDRLHPVPDGLPYRVLNMYGPTETTVVAAAGWVTPGGSGLPPIGQSLPYAHLRVVAGDGSPSATGERGELWVGGGGLADGYLDDPLLSAARFVADPYSAAGEPAYRTGDLVRQRPDGVLEFIGRDDRQVQIGGVRTELGEIEAIAMRQPGVRQAVAVAGQDGQRNWVRLYVVPDQPAAAEPLGPAIRSALPPHLRHLPVQPVAALPLTASGKVDQAALVAGEPADRDATGAVSGDAAAVPGAADLLAPLLRQLPAGQALALAYRLLGSVIGDRPPERGR
jgi:amino acid adenylation domain-containing protein